jgi:hypothetical protein
MHSSSRKIELFVTCPKIQFRNSNGSVGKQTALLENKYIAVNFGENLEGRGERGSYLGKQMGKLEEGG